MYDSDVIMCTFLNADGVHAAMPAVQADRSKAFVLLLLSPVVSLLQFVKSNQSQQAG